MLSLDAGASRICRDLLHQRRKSVGTLPLRDLPTGTRTSLSRTRSRTVSVQHRQQQHHHHHTSSIPLSLNRRITGLTTPGASSTPTSAAITTTTTVSAHRDVDTRSKPAQPRIAKSDVLSCPPIRLRHVEGKDPATTCITAPLSVNPTLYNLPPCFRPFYSTLLHRSSATSTGTSPGPLNERSLYIKTKRGELVKMAVQVVHADTVYRVTSESIVYIISGTLTPSALPSSCPSPCSPVSPAQALHGPAPLKTSGTISSPQSLVAASATTAKAYDSAALNTCFRLTALSTIHSCTPCTLFMISNGYDEYSIIGT